MLNYGCSNPHQFSSSLDGDLKAARASDDRGQAVSHRCGDMVKVLYPPVSPVSISYFTMANQLNPCCFDPNHQLRSNYYQQSEYDLVLSKFEPGSGGRIVLRPQEERPVLVQSPNNNMDQGQGPKTSPSNPQDSEKAKTFLLLLCLAILLPPVALGIKQDWKFDIHLILNIILFLSIVLWAAAVIHACILILVD